MRRPRSRWQRIGRPAALLGIALAVLAGCDPFASSGSAPPGALGGPSSTVGPSATPLLRPTAVPSRSPNATPTATPNPTPSPSPSAPAQAGADTLIGACPGRAPTDLAVGTADSVESRNWSGYVATGATTFTCVEGIWTQPKVRCRGSAQQAAVYWVGLGGYDHRSLVQIGTESVCIDGVAQAAAWHESLPRETYAIRANLQVSVGDRMWAQVRSVGSGRYRMTLVNLTTRKHISIRVVNSTLKRTSAEWIVEAPTGGCPQACHTLRLPNFRTIHFEEAWLSLDGIRRPLTGSRFVHTREAMTTGDGQTRSEVSSTGKDGTSFAVRWRRP